MSKYRSCGGVRMKKLRDMSVFLIANIFVFYVLPLLIQDTGSAMFILLIVIPVVCFILSLIYGIVKSFDFIYTLMVMLIFASTLFIFYNESAAIYILIYGIISLIGSFIGGLFSKKKK